MPELALGLLLLYGAVALGVRLFLHWRWTGSTGFSLPRGGAPERIAAALIAASLALYVAAPIACVTGSLGRPKTSVRTAAGAGSVSKIREGALRSSTL
jgi:hypothetical protein